MRNFGYEVSVRTYIRPSIETLGEGEGVPGQPDHGEENAIFWKRGFFKSLIFGKTIARKFSTQEKWLISIMLKWKAKSSSYEPKFVFEDIA